MSHGAAPPASVPHYTDVNRGNSFLAASAATITLCFIVVALRVYTRLRYAAGLGKDDWMIIIGTSIAIVGFSFNVVQTHHGNGRHMKFLSPTDRMIAVQYNQYSQLQQTLGLYFTKLSICFFLLRILDRTHRVVIRLTYAMIVFLTIVHIIVVVIWSIQCIPLAGLWDPRVAKTGKCLHGSIVVGVVYLQSAVSLITDLICAFVPAYFIHQLQIARVQKILLVTLIGFGLLTCVAGALKIYYLPQLIANKADYTWTIINVSMCAMIEENVGIILAAIPALKPLFSKWWDAAATTIQRSTNANMTAGGTRPSTKSFQSIDDSAHSGRTQTPEARRPSDMIPLHEQSPKGNAIVQTTSLTTSTTVVPTWDRQTNRFQ